MKRKRTKEEAATLRGTLIICFIGGALVLGVEYSDWFRDLLTGTSGRVIWGTLLFVSIFIGRFLRWILPPIR